MNQEDKELLLKDLCARLPYGVKCYWKKDYKCVLSSGFSYEECIGTLIKLDATEYAQLIYLRCKKADGWKNYWEIKPYLRSMSSMTKAERKEYHSYCDYYYGTYFDTVGSIDYLNKKMFDHRKDDEGKTMIKKGLALEAPEGMYK